MAKNGVESEKSEKFGAFTEGTYSDGHPLDEIHYLECKLILKPDRFTSLASFNDYARLVAQAAGKHGVDFSTKGFKNLRPRFREVVFLDTHDFSLYNHAFIFRRRIAFEDGFPVGEPEIVFKFRHPDLLQAAQMDVRPKIPGKYKIKFKAEALPLKDQFGGYRMLYSHNVQFGLSESNQVDRGSFSTLSNLFPALATLKSSGDKKIELVNHTIVEEVMQYLGELDFGHGVAARADAALWRQRGDHQLLIGEFSFQCKFKRKSELHDKALERCKEFFASLQHIGREWVSLGTTKTGVIYRLHGNPPNAHE
jgi:hypothetical protein